MSILPDTIAAWPRDRKEGLLAYLGRFLTGTRLDTIRDVVSKRTRHITVVLENIYQPHNASAVLRSCEIFGIQDVRTIEDRYPFRPNKEVAMGAGKWLDLYRYEPEIPLDIPTCKAPLPTDNTLTRRCFADLRAQGYRIAATALREDSIPLCEVPLDNPVALVFGTEADGVSDATLDEADMVVQIPMFGFTQSFNISVSAALCLYDLTTRLRAAGDGWMLSDEERLDLEISWLLRCLARGEDYILRFGEEYDLRTGPSSAE